MAKKSSMNRTRWIFAIVLSIAILAYVQYSQPPTTIHQLQLSTLDSIFNVTNVTVQYPAGQNTSNSTSYYAYFAQTTAQQELGYMNQTWIGDCNMHAPCLGMVFDIGNQSNICFWMKNTEIPLKQIWISNTGTVTYIYNGIPYSTVSICSPGTYVLETSINSTIAPGDIITISNQTIGNSTVSN